MSGEQAYGLVIDDAEPELQKQVSEALATYAAPSRGPQDDLMKATKLKGAYTAIQDWLLGQVLPALNEAQWLFLSTGALGDRIPLGAQGTAELLPEGTYAMLEASRNAKAQRPPWAAVILDFEDRVNAIAKGELVGMDQSGKRRGKPTKVLGAEHFKGKVQNRLENAVFEVKELLSQVEIALGTFAPLREETVFRGAKINLEVLKKFTAIASNTVSRTEAEAKFLASAGEKTSGLITSMNTLGQSLTQAGSVLATSTDSLSSKIYELKGALEEKERLEKGEDIAAGGMFDSDTITSIRHDADTLAQFMVRAAEASESKVSFTGSRVLVKEQWQTLEGAKPADCIATVTSVVAALEKIAKIHVNVFPRDPDGHLMLPTILIEPIRNYIEWFDDRLAIALVSGETPKRGPKVSLTPLEVHILRMCGVFLSKDPLYDYRGEMNIGTFIGDYSGKTEKKTSVKWSGENKKFSMASTSEVVDGASRAEAVQDYIDCVFAFANGLQPPMKLSKRKVAVILRYCVIESVERTIALTLMNVAQHEPNEAKETILKHIKKEEEARAAVIKCFKDPQLARVLGDQDFFVNRMFGKQ